MSLRKKKPKPPKMKPGEAEPREPGLRIVDGRRINLAAARARKLAFKEGNRPLHPQPTVEQVQAKKSAERKRQSVEAKRMTRLRSIDGGKEGMESTDVSVQLSGNRNKTMEMRSKPGSFEWRYGRNKQSMLFHAGSHLAQLWERAGMTTASSANFLRGIASGYSTGISEGRLNAIEKLDGFCAYLGTVGAQRMIAYCVSGQTSAEIARKEKCEERAMSTILHHDLRKTAEFLRFRAVNKARSAYEMT